MSLITYHQYEEALRDWLGDRVTFRPNWRNANSPGGFDAHGFMHHWTAIKNHDPLVQCRVLENNGSLGLSAHLSPARNGRLYVLAGPRANANHAGRGSLRVYRKVLKGRYDGTPHGVLDIVDGNSRFYGLEYQYHPDEGTMRDEQVECGILAAAAISQAHGWGPNTAAGSNLDHYEWTRRKWDREVQNLANRTRDGVRTALRNPDNHRADRKRRPEPEPKPQPEEIDMSKFGPENWDKADWERFGSKFLGQVEMNWHDGAKGDDAFEGKSLRDVIKAIARKTGAVDAEGN